MRRRERRWREGRGDEEEGGEMGGRRGDGEYLLHSLHCPLTIPGMHRLSLRVTRVQGTKSQKQTSASLSLAFTCPVRLGLRPSHPQGH